MTDYIVVANNTIQSVTDYTTNIVSYITKVREPIISSTQGPQGPPGATGVGYTGATGAASTVPGPPGTSAATSVSTLLDVDLSTGVPDGALLIYGSADLKWKASRILEKQAFECGQY
jgi:hypothetical protein